MTRRFSQWMLAAAATILLPAHGIAPADVSQLKPTPFDAWTPDAAIEYADFAGNWKHHEVKTIDTVHFGSYTPQLGLPGSGMRIGDGVKTNWLIRDAELVIDANRTLSYKYEGTEINSKKKCTITTKIEGKGKYSISESGLVIINYASGSRSVDNQCNPKDSKAESMAGRQHYFASMEVRVKQGPKRLRVKPQKEDRGMNFEPS